MIRRVRPCWHKPQQNISGDCSAAENFDFFHFRGRASPPHRHHCLAALRGDNHRPPRVRVLVELRQVALHDDHGFTVPQLKDQRSGKPCAACGTVKRYHFNRIAVDLGYSVVATGHNLDDEAATLFGNVMHWQTDFLGRQGPVLESTHPGLARKVKPLYKLAEREMAAYCLIERIDYILEECPMAIGAKSLEYKAVLNTLEESQPGLKQRFLTGFLKQRAQLPVAQPAFELRECVRCGSPTTAEVCVYCRMVERQKRKQEARAAARTGL